MKPVNVIAKRSDKIKFIILQVLTILLVAITLVSFSDITLPPMGSKIKKADKFETTHKLTQTKDDTNAELEKKLEQTQSLVSNKQQRINELEKQLQALQNNTAKGDNKESDEVALLKNNLQQMHVQLTDKEAMIKELEGRIQTLQNTKNTTVPNANNAIIEKLKADVQKLETRNALLVKLNDDLKKNNEYLSGLQKASGAAK